MPRELATNLRELINDNKGVTGGIAALFCMLALLRIVHHPGAQSTTPHAKGFFSVDDGKTVFIDNLTKLPPFDHEGQTAVRSMVMTTDGGRHQWTQYLLKYSDDARGQVERMLSKSDYNPVAAQMTLFSGQLVKKPGDDEWVSMDDKAAFAKICKPSPPPDFPKAPATMVEPWDKETP